jgi:hypothetical protein
VKVSRKWSMAFGYLPPLVSSLLFGGMYHSAAITCGERGEGAVVSTCMHEMYHSAAIT